MYLGYNPLSKIEVVSSLNLFNQGRAMYYYDYTNCTAKYAPKVYVGTPQTLGIDWNYDHHFGPNLTWPQAFQGSQKGEANINNKYSSKYIRNIYILI